MAEKDLLEIIADMLRKLDQHSEILEKQGEVLTTFMDGSLKQFDQQMIINEKIIKRLENLEAKMDRS